MKVADLKKEMIWYIQNSSLSAPEKKIVPKKSTWKPWLFEDKWNYNPEYINRFEYNINLFTYSKTGRVLFGYENKLHIIGYRPSFPNGRRQFFIKNYQSQGFRRFRLYKETDEYYEFKSEDLIRCVIFKSTDNEEVRTARRIESNQ